MAASFCSSTGSQPIACVPRTSIPIPNEKNPSGSGLPIGRGTIAARGAGAPFCEGTTSVYRAGRDANNGKP
jgi:hypothetical protein